MTRHGLARDLRMGAVELVRPGASQLSGASLWRAGQVVLATVIVATNLVGAVVVVVLATSVVPMPPVLHGGRVVLGNVLGAAAYVLFAVPVGAYVGIRALFRLRVWLTENRAATVTEQRLVLRAPLRLFVLQVALWAGAAVVFGLLNGRTSPSLGLRVAATVMLTGVATAACAYLFTERLLRPAAARALVHEAPERLIVPGVASRAVLAWALGTGVPVLGLLGIGVVEGVTGDATRGQLLAATITLTAVALSVGLLAVGVAARATADPVDAVRRGMATLQEGDFSTRVPVYDGTQLGQLQIGFNRMAAGLAERERMREAFGTYLDPDVAERVLSEGTDLEGEDVEVTVMFVDIRDFTGFAERHEARAVVAAINRLFADVVPIVHGHGGRVDKFIGDGLLAVFGAPRRLADHAECAVRAAVDIARCVERGDLRVGIGLNSGHVVAGNVGGAGRLEFSVIGDVVNTAARVEAATRATGDAILVAEPTAALVGARCGQLEERPGIELKGKREPVKLYAVRA